jgi:hypothetical protein
LAERQRRDRAKLAALVRAGLVSRTAQQRASAKRIESLWDSWGALIANPDARPFHRYRPRSKKGRAAMAELAPRGVSTRGLKAIPIPILSGAKGARVRIDEDAVKIHYKSGAIVEQIRIAIDPKEIASGRGLDKILARVDELSAGKHDISVNLRTGPGTYSPLAHGESTEESIRRLKRAYPNWRKWLQAVEIIVSRNGD